MCCLKCEADCQPCHLVKKSVWQHTNQLFQMPKLLAKFKTLEHTGARLFAIVGVAITHTWSRTHTQIRLCKFYLRISYVFGWVCTIKKHNIQISLLIISNKRTLTDKNKCVRACMCG